MELDYKTAQKKEQEIYESLRTSLISMGMEPSVTEEFISAKLNSSIAVKPPKKQVTEATAGATSKADESAHLKPGNIKLSIIALIDQIVKTSVAGINISPEPWVAVYAFIEVLRQSSKLHDVKISEIDAMVIWTMWFVRNRRSNTVSSDDLLTKLNTHITKYERTPLTQEDVDASLKTLEKISTIRQSKNSSESWYLVGWVKRSYS